MKQAKRNRWVNIRKNYIACKHPLVGEIKTQWEAFLTEICVSALGKLVSDEFRRWGESTGYFKWTEEAHRRTVDETETYTAIINRNMALIRSVGQTSRSNRYWINPARK